MNRRVWIICERTGRWAAALRMAIDRADWSTLRRPRLFEVRRIEELSQRLDTRPGSLALLEVHSANFSDMLALLTNAARRFPELRFVALMDHDLSGPPELKTACRRSDRDPVGDALREAGATILLRSPRQVTAILQLDRQHAAFAQVRRDPTSAQITDWAWAALPWQDE